MRLPVLRKVAALQPTELSDVTQRAVEDLLREGESRNTLASYRSALRYWAAWYGIRYGGQVKLPIPAACVLQFIVDHAERTTDKGLVSELPAEIDQALVQGGYKGKLGAMAHNTLVHRIAVLSKAHQMRELKKPCHDPKVRELLSRTRKAYAKRGALPQKKDALTKDPLQAILATCDDSLRGKRDRALLLFAWASGGHIGESLSPAAVRTIVKERCALAGIEGDFSAHSLRSGFVTEAGRQNVPLAETMAMTGHKSVPTVLGYFRSESALKSSAARLIE